MLLVRFSLLIMIIVIKYYYIIDAFQNIASRYWNSFAGIPTRSTCMMLGNYPGTNLLYKMIEELRSLWLVESSVLYLRWSTRPSSRACIVHYLLTESEAFTGKFQTEALPYCFFLSVSFLFSFTKRQIISNIELAHSTLLYNICIITILHSVTTLLKE